METINWRDLIGQEGKFYGVFNNFFKIGSVVFEAVEDPDDGYRSNLDHLRVAENLQDLIFFTEPLATVKFCVSDKGCFDGFELIEFDKKLNVEVHKWLEVGTEVSDDYYPCFVFYYFPKASLTDVIDRFND